MTDANRMPKKTAGARRCYCTVATCNYLAYVRALASQLQRHEPNARFFALMVDKPLEPLVTADLPFDIHFLEDVSERKWFTQASYFYSAFELANNVKPFAHRLAMEYYGADEWAYIDSDIYVTGDLSPLWAEGGDIILTPHVREVEYGMKRRKEELFFLRYGIINGGIVACRRSTAAEGFIRWFQEALSYGGFNEWRHEYVDQKWLGLASAFFPSTSYCSHPGINVGFWNSLERKLTIRPDGKIAVNDQPLLAFHFSKWSPEKWDCHPFGNASIDRVAWFALGQVYRDLLMAEGWAQYRRMPYRYERDITHRRITREMRRACFLRRNEVTDPWKLPRWRHQLAAGRLIFKQLGWEIVRACVGCLRLVGWNL